jgi:hypothetical protein
LIYNIGSYELLHCCIPTGTDIKIDCEYIMRFLQKHVLLLKAIDAWADGGVESRRFFCCQTVDLLSVKVGDKFNFGQFPCCVLSTPESDEDGYGCMEGLTHFQAIVLHPQSDGHLDRCPIYGFDIATGTVQRGTADNPRGDYGCIRKWFEDRLQGYLEWVAGNGNITGTAEDEIVIRAESMYHDLQYFALEYIHPTKEWEETAFQDAVILM